MYTVSLCGNTLVSIVPEGVGAFEAGVTGGCSVNRYRLGDKLQSFAKTVCALKC